MGAERRAELGILLHKIYVAAYRFNDLLSVIQPEGWKMSDNERKVFEVELKTARDQYQQLEETRSQYYEHADQLRLGERLLTAINDLVPSINDVAAAVSQHEGASSGDPYQQPGKDLSALAPQLNSYLDSLRPRAKPAAMVASNASATAESKPPAAAEAKPAIVAPPPVVQTETVAVSKESQAPPAPLTAEAEAPDINTLLHDVYSASYRFSDLLTVLDTKGWKMDEAARSSLDSTLAAAHDQLKRLEESRSQLAQQPDNVYLSFETHLALEALIPTIKSVAHGVSEQENPRTGAQFEQSATQLSHLMESVNDYLASQLRNQEQVRGALENNLASCQSTLNYAMRGTAATVTPMKNINPVFQGRGRHHDSVAAEAQSQAAGNKKNSAEKAKKPLQPVTAHAGKALVPATAHHTRPRTHHPLTRKPPSAKNAGSGKAPAHAAGKQAAPNPAKQHLPAKKN